MKKLLMQILPTILNVGSNIAREVLLERANQRPRPDYVQLMNIPRDTIDQMYLKGDLIYEEYLQVLQYQQLLWDMGATRRNIERKKANRKKLVRRMLDTIF